MNLHPIFQDYQKPILLYNKYLCEYDTKESEINPIFEKNELPIFLKYLKNHYKNNYELIIFLDNFCNNKNAAYLKLFENMLTPEKFNELVDSFSINQYDILDLCGYRGSGYYYVYKFNKQLFVEKTLGEYGYYLPFESRNFILKYGIKNSDNFGISNILGFHIPRGTIIISNTNNQQSIIDNDETYFDMSYSDGENSEYIIEGAKFIGVLC